MKTDKICLILENRWFNSSLSRRTLDWSHTADCLVYSCVYGNRLSMRCCFWLALYFLHLLYRFPVFRAFRLKNHSKQVLAVQFSQCLFNPYSTHYKFPEFPSPDKLLLSKCSRSSGLKFLKTSRKKQFEIYMSQASKSRVT